jgi:hypothetical protein
MSFPSYVGPHSSYRFPEIDRYIKEIIQGGITDSLDACVFYKSMILPEKGLEACLPAYTDATSNFPSKSKKTKNE